MTKKTIKIHEVLPRLLSERKMSIRELSRRAKVPQTTLNSWTRPNAKPSDIFSLKAVAEILQVSSDYLCWGEDTKSFDLENLETDILLQGLFKIKLERVRDPSKGG